METICGGLRVVEIGSGSVAAALTGVVLADAGARVIKVEPPSGDRQRTSNPSGFRVWNRGKESLLADLRTSEGQQQLRALAQHADILIEGFAPGTTEAWGVGAETLRAANPGLVHCAITGFGASGPYAKLKGYDSLVAAKLGLWSRGDFLHRPGASMSNVAWGSFGAAMQSVAGILAALHVREQTGRGQSLSSTLAAGLDPLDYFASTVVQLAAKKGEKVGGGGLSLRGASRYGVVVATRDGRFIQTSTLLPHQGQALCDVAGIGHCTQEPRFRNLPMFDSIEDAQAWEDLLIEAFRERDLDHWLPMLEASPDIAFEVSRTSEEALSHPQYLHNGDVITIDDPEVGPIRQVGPIGRFSRTPIVPARPSPALGQNAGAFREAPLPEGGAPFPAHPLAGITLVEFGYFYAMPYALSMAASLGARVVKIEDGKGDPHRASFGPEVASNKTTAAKESLSLDLRSDEGREIAQSLVARADAFVSGFRTGVAEKLGLGYDELRARNERLLYVHAAGYGSDGPYAHRALYAQAAQAAAGSYGRQVGYWSDPSRNVGLSVLELQALVLPRLGQVVDGDSNAALGLLAALSLGLYHQQRTGQGQRLSTSMICGNAWAYSDDFCAYAGKPAMPLTDEEYYGISALDRVYPAADASWLCVAVHTQTEFERLIRALGEPELAADVRFQSAEARAANDAELIKALSAVIALKPALEWESVFSAAGAPGVAVSMDGQSATTSFDPGLRAAGLTVAYEHPLFGEMVRAAPPVAFSETSSRVAPPCARGQHNRSILGELGYSDEQIAGFESKGVITPPS